jgi:hypothetical protein
MPSAAWALQQAIFARLSADAALLALLGGPRVYDDVPQGAAFPYLTLGQSVARDWSTGSDDGSEHILTVHAWSKAGGKREVLEILGSVRAALHDTGLTLTGHRLVNLRHEHSEARRDPDGDVYHGIARFRAVTEPA